MTFELHLHQHNQLRDASKGPVIGVFYAGSDNVVRLVVRFSSLRYGRSLVFHADGVVYTIRRSQRTIKGAYGTKVAQKMVVVEAYCPTTGEQVELPDLTVWHPINGATVVMCYHCGDDVEYVGGKPPVKCPTCGKRWE